MDKFLYLILMMFVGVGALLINRIAEQKGQIGRKKERKLSVLFF